MKRAYLLVILVAASLGLAQAPPAQKKARHRNTVLRYNWTPTTQTSLLRD
jgi:hypothetical protein